MENVIAVVPLNINEKHIVFLDEYGPRANCGACGIDHDHINGRNWQMESWFEIRANNSAISMLFGGVYHMQRCCGQKMKRCVGIFYRRCLVSGQEEGSQGTVAFCTKCKRYSKEVSAFNMGGW